MMSKRVGAIPEETKEWITDAAIKEFSEYGLNNSSLRRICNKANVTTGALYFFFKSKDDLFQAVISQVTVPFIKLIKEHYDFERSEASRLETSSLDADYEISRMLIELYFENQEIWNIIINHLNHWAVKDFIDTFVNISSQQYVYLLEKIDLSFRQTPIEEFSIHQYVHMQVDAMLTLISHSFNKEDMIKHAKTVIRMLRGAFQALINE